MEDPNCIYGYGFKLGWQLGQLSLWRTVTQCKSMLSQLFQDFQWNPKKKSEDADAEILEMALFGLVYPFPG
jgi:hypothetical protein